MGRGLTGLRRTHSFQNVTQPSTWSKINCVESLLDIPDRCALFALEDILGGHSAVSNIALRAMIDLGTRPATQVGTQYAKLSDFYQQKYWCTRSLGPLGPALGLSVVALPPQFTLNLKQNIFFF